MKQLLVILLALLSVPTWAAIAVGQHADASHASSATTAGVTTAGSGSSFVIVAGYSAGSFTSVADSKSNSYTIIGSERTSDGHSLRWYLCTNCTGGASHTATCVAGAVTCYFVEITGGVTASLLDQNTGGADASSPYGDALTITTTQADELLLGVISGDSGSNPWTATPGNSFTTVDNEADGGNFWPSNLQQRVVSSTGTYAISNTVSNSVTNGLVLIASFKAAGGGGGTVVNPINGIGGAAARPIGFNQHAANDEEFRLRASR